MPDHGPTQELLTIDDALARLLELAPPPPASETVSLRVALGRVLAAPVVAGVDVPFHDNSAMDGYALRVSELGAERRLPVGSVVPAGAPPGRLAQGQAARIFTGAPLPAGADAVVMQERCERVGDEVLFPADVRVGQNVRRAGEDVKKGARVLEAGMRLRPQELGLAASVGGSQLSVRRRLKVALLSTGDELVEPGVPLSAGRIHDANTPMLTGFLESLGLEVSTIVHVPDRYDATLAALSEAATSCDVIVSSGGVSVGDEDHVVRAVAALGRIDLWRVAVKPGKPFAFGFVGDTPFLGLPGNPVAVFTTFLMLARPFLQKQQGRTLVVEPWHAVPAAFDWPTPATQRREYLRARLDGDGESRRVELFPRQGSGVLSSCVWADGLVRLEPAQSVRRGDRVCYLSLADLLA